MEPRAATRRFVRTLHGVSTADPYAWMADHADPDLIAYLRAERRHYDERLAKLKPLRGDLVAEAVGRFGDFAADDPPWTVAGREFRWRQPPGADYRVLVMGPDTVVLDENALAGPGGHVRLGTCVVSPDAAMLAYSVDTTGEERFELRVRDLRTGEDLHAIPDTVGACAWSRDAKVLLYVRPDEANRPWQVSAHVVGGADHVVFTEPDRRFAVELATTSSGRRLTITSSSRTTSEVWLLDAAAPLEAPVRVRPRKDGVIYTVDHDDEGVTIVTNRHEPEFAVEGGPASAMRVRTAARHAGRWVLTGIRDGVPLVSVHQPSGEVLEVLPDDPAGTLTLDAVGDRSLLVSMASLTGDRTRWTVSLEDGHRTRVPRGGTRGPYRTRRLMVPARDGVEVPVSLVHHASVDPDGDSPCLIRAYGAYEAVLAPVADPMLPSLLDRGVVYAIAHVRGGGERGRWWYEDGRLARKWHSFTDLVDVRDALVGERWAAPGRVACRGMSAGGMLVAGAYTLWPERWCAVVAEVPAADCLNTMLDPDIPLVVNELEEWGDPRERGAFASMRRYVAYENVYDRPRPPLLVTGIMRDPRVMIQEPAKWVAALRAADTRGNDVLFRPEFGDMPHSGPAGRYARAAYEAEVAAFLLQAFGLAP